MTYCIPYRYTNVNKNLASSYTPLNSALYSCGFSAQKKFKFLSPPCERRHADAMIPFLFPYFPSQQQHVPLSIGEFGWPGTLSVPGYHRTAKNKRSIHFQFAEIPFVKLLTTGFLVYTPLCALEMLKSPINTGTFAR
jgi:hypothetical protein